MRQRDQQRLIEAAVWALQYRQVRLAVLAVACIALGVWLIQGRPGCEPSRSAIVAGPGEYQLCFWNVENLFDDRDDRRNASGDKEYDGFFSSNPEALQAKLGHLVDVLLSGEMNGGRGPDILCVAELESRRAGELLKQALNARLLDETLHYTTLLFANPGGGRHIGTGILTRLPVAGKGALLGRRLRILEGTIEVDSKPLVVVASHWSSRISDKDSATRSTYADVIYRRYQELYRDDPNVDFLVCGDFNDNPDDASVLENLRAKSSLVEARAAGGDPALVNLMAPLWANSEATLYHNARPYLFDQICVSPGLFDEQGWSIVPNSTRIIRQKAQRNGRPDRFGGESDKRPYSARGASDHFPVCVLLRVGQIETAKP